MVSSASLKFPKSDVLQKISAISSTHTHIPNPGQSTLPASFHQNHKSNNCLQWHLEVVFLRTEHWKLSCRKECSGLMLCWFSQNTYIFTHDIQRPATVAWQQPIQKMLNFATTIVVNGSWRENEMFPGRSLKMDMVARLQPIQVKTSSSAKAIVVNVLARRLVSLGDGWKGDK